MEVRKTSNSKPCDHARTVAMIQRFFINEYVRSLLKLSISCLHRCVNILTFESSKESMNLFVLPICCVSQGQTEYASTSL